MCKPNLAICLGQGLPLKKLFTLLKITKGQSVYNNLHSFRPSDVYTFPSEASVPNILAM